ncbi:hypothetical protein [Vitiosangium sp. GDMCC 1.1324]|uniref:hypothetical protein n=1 Tax=Vitiosangium sp. (strain GDMCC 1.1324) TaxID=2138576 RepID=UPI000D33DA67|nr:hypothetical protein [Vitiosangium sp. GDMCC 1.1324]PTL76476.1 hypothetical protein DAT35_50030 [Vitiosangium sp. GDMCC 1.1324]
MHLLFVDGLSTHFSGNIHAPTAQTTWPDTRFLACLLYEGMPQMQNPTGEISYSHTDDDGMQPEKGKFGHGHSVPSCDACQKLIPEMLCDNHQECA